MPYSLRVTDGDVFLPVTVSLAASKQNVILPTCNRRRRFALCQRAFGCVKTVKSAVSKSLDHFTAVSGVGSSPAVATCETSQVLLAGVPGGFSRVLPFSPHLLLGPSHMS